MPGSPRLPNLRSLQDTRQSLRGGWELVEVKGCRLILFRRLIRRLSGFLSLNVLILSEAFRTLTEKVRTFSARASTAVLPHEQRGDIQQCRKRDRSKAFNNFNSCGTQKLFGVQVVSDLHVFPTQGPTRSHWVFLKHLGACSLDVCNLHTLFRQTRLLKYNRCNITPGLRKFWKLYWLDISRREYLFEASWVTIGECNDTSLTFA